MSDPRTAHDELASVAADFDREDASLGPRDETTAEWFELLLRRLDALDRLRAVAPSDPLVALQDAADRLNTARLERWVRANRRAAA